MWKLSLYTSEKQAIIFTTNCFSCTFVYKFIFWGVSNIARTWQNRSKNQFENNKKKWRAGLGNKAEKVSCQQGRVLFPCKGSCLIHFIVTRRGNEETDQRVSWSRVMPWLLRNCDWYSKKPPPQRHSQFSEIEKHLLSLSFVENFISCNSFPLNKAVFN